MVYRDLENQNAEKTIWVEKLESSYYRVENIPFYAPNLAYNDEIAVENDDGVLYIDDLIQSSGH